jgi:hypothetical protein
MNFKLQKLVVQFGRSREEIELDHHLTIFHGKISSGKSTIAKLIDACLGGSLPQVPAIKQEFVSAELSARIGQNDVLFERNAGSRQVQVTWTNANGESASLMAPIDNAPSPIWGDKVYGLSDLIFELAGVGPMRVRRNKTDPDAPLIPLSFRDIMWYCYLDQDELDSTFFHLEAEESQEADTHFSDDLRTELRSLANRIEAETEAVANGERILSEEMALRGELISAKFKLHRMSSATVILGAVEYTACPRCGTDLAELSRLSTDCHLCGAPEKAQSNRERRQTNIDQPDLDARLADIEQSISTRKKSLIRQQRELEALKEQKSYKDLELTRLMRNYDSAFLSQVRNLERELASGRQEIIGLRRDARLPQALFELESEADNHLTNAQRIRRELKAERDRIADQDNLVGQLEGYVFDALMSSGFPALSTSDTLHINRRNWMAYIFPHGDESLSYTLSGAGSGGKKTLFNICYAIALHRLAEELDLPLPLFVIIDSPMKNIGTEVNKDIFIAFYKHLYGLLSSVMTKTQVIIIDTELSAPAIELDFTERLMIAGDPEHPPLIPYYSGH